MRAVRAAPSFARRIDLASHSLDNGAHLAARMAYELTRYGRFNALELEDRTLCDIVLLDLHQSPP